MYICIVTGSNEWTLYIPLNVVLAYMTFLLRLCYALIGWERSNFIFMKVGVKTMNELILDFTLNDSEAEESRYVNRVAVSHCKANGLSFKETIIVTNLARKHSKYNLKPAAESTIKRLYYPV